MTKLKGKVKAKARQQKIKKIVARRSAYRQQLVAKILKYDNPILAQKCEPVVEGSDVSEKISLMKKVLGSTANGVGLASSQIGILDRIIAIRSDLSSHDITIMINPEVLEHSEEKEYGFESCLSYPNISSIIERFKSIKVKYFDENWQEKIVEYKKGDSERVIIQHELDHLNEGHCQVHNWWKNPQGKQEEIKNILGFKKDDSYEVVESEDLQKEKAETSE